MYTVNDLLVRLELIVNQLEIRLRKEIHQTCVNYLRLTLIQVLVPVRKRSTRKHSEGISVR